MTNTDIGLIIAIIVKAVAITIYIMKIKGDVKSNSQEIKSNRVLDQTEKKSISKDIKNNHGLFEIHRTDNNLEHETLKESIEKLDIQMSKKIDNVKDKLEEVGNVVIKIHTLLGRRKEDD
jgi:hypothetical protein